MTHLLIFLLLSLWQHRSIDHISRHNLARKEAETAYNAGDFRTAADRYAYLNRTGSDGAIRLNAGHVYFRLRQFGKAKEQYEALLSDEDPALTSAAAIQLGVIACYERDSATALTLFRQALLQDPNSEPARYNFELIQRQFSGKTPPKKKPAAPQRQAQQQTLSNNTVERSDKEEERLRRFSELNMTEDQAMQLLDAMQGNDLPYSSLRPFQGARTSRSSGRERNRW